MICLRCPISEPCFFFFFLLSPSLCRVKAVVISQDTVFCFGVGSIFSHSLDTSILICCAVISHCFRILLLYLKMKPLWAAESGCVCESEPSRLGSNRTGIIRGEGIPCGKEVAQLVCLPGFCLFSCRTNLFRR